MAIVIKFSKSMNTSTILGNITIEPGVQIQDYIWKNGNKTLTLTLASNLSSYTWYKIVIKADMKDSGIVLDSNGVEHKYSVEKNLESTYVFSFRTKDVTSPEITDVQANPSPQEVYGYVNITAFVSDNVMVNNVYVNITYPNGTQLGNFSMNGVELDANKNGTYYCNITYSVLGTYSYYIWVNDTSNNQNKSDTYQFIIRDTTPPQISSIQDFPDPQEVYGYVNITCTVTDNVAVNVLKVNITSPNSEITNISMIRISGTDNYYYNTIYSIKGIYSYYIWANDTSGNGNISTIHYFTIQDTTEPIISNIQATPSLQAQSGWVNISCTVIDNFDYPVNNVKVNITGPIGFTPINITMTQIPGTNNYYYNSTYAIAGLYSFHIWANDTSANENESMEYYFTITIALRKVIEDREVNVIGIGNGTVNIEAVGLPQSLPEKLQNITCIEVTITGKLTYINIIVKYSDDDVKGLNEATLKMYYWTGTEWKLCNNTG
ncbi:MAG: Ig-like domain-containing protein, partial [Elusimicrobiota bacterium]|nr:Ig-like domain-containing protein [Elusimicrobiota bacterium]